MSKNKWSWLSGEVIEITYAKVAEVISDTRNVQYFSEIAYECFRSLATPLDDVYLRAIFLLVDFCN